MKSFITSSLLALMTLVTAHGATFQSPNNISVPEEKETRPVAIVLHQSNDGAKVTIPNGAVVRVILESNAASTGFDWSPAFSSSDVLAFQGKNIKKVSSHLLGGAVKEIWIFKATTPGQTFLTFSLARSWEKNVSPVQTVQFDITVD